MLLYSLRVLFVRTQRFVGKPLCLYFHRIFLQQLEQTVRKLISQERDPDASQAIREAVLEMDRIEVAMETVSAEGVLQGPFFIEKYSVGSL